MKVASETSLTAWVGFSEVSRMVGPFLGCDMDGTWEESWETKRKAIAMEWTR